jgi:hypothetical protein
VKLVKTKTIIAMFLLCAAPAFAEEEIFINETAGCDRFGFNGPPFSLHGEVTLLDALKALSRSFCEHYYLPKSLAQKKVTLLPIEPEVRSFERERRVVAALRANGYELDPVSTYRVKRYDFDDPLARVAPPPSRMPAAELDKGIRCKDTRCEIDRQLFDKLLRDTTMLASEARFVPSIRDGKPNGFKFYAILAGSVYARIGLQNGDTLKAVNGEEISTPDRALSVYTKMHKAEKLSLSLERRGEPVTLELVIK